MANTTLQLRKSGETGNVPPSLAYGELALNYADGKLFYKAANGTITYIQSGGGGGSSSNSFATINVDSSLILATSPTDTLSFVAGNNVTISACTISKTITINSSDIDQFARNTANTANTPAGSTTQVQFNDGGIRGASSSLTFDKASGIFSTKQIIVTNSVGDEGGEILLAKPASNTTLVGTGITIDAFQNKIRFFEQGGTARGAYIDLTECAGGAGTNLLSGGGGATIDQYARDTANLSIGIDVTQNTRLNSIETINTNQNTSISIIQGVDLEQNSAISIIQGVDLEQNSAISIIQGVDLAQNTTITEINQYAAGAYSTANTNATNITSVNGFAVSAYNQANSSTLLAQSAYDTANLKFNTSGGTITGNVTISTNSNLTVTGNLTVLGTTTTVNTNLLEVNDPMILLAANNFYSDGIDIGFSGSYNNGANAHTGLFRDAPGNKDWYFFENYTPEVSGNNNINIADASFRTSNVNVNYLKGNLIATTAVVNTANVQQLNIAGSAFINTNRTITYYGTTHNQLGSGSGTRDINLTLGNFISATVAGVTTWTFSNPIASPAVTGFILELTNGGSAGISWPASVKWPGGTAPSLTAAGVDVLTFFTDDGGTTYRGVVSMLDSK
jgi:hypothetical protein